jgi:hypothetical protein
LKENMKLNKKRQKQRYRQVIPNFEPETRFEVGAAARGPVEADLEQLKARLLQPLLKAAADPADATPLHRAANEAASLAWFTPFPLLFFPALLEEKIYAAQRQELRQRQILERTEGLLDQAVA